MAWGWVDTIVEFLKVNRDKAHQPSATVQQAFRSMLAALAEVDQQKNLISFDVISVSSHLHPDSWNSVLTDTCRSTEHRALYCG